MLLQYLLQFCKGDLPWFVMWYDFYPMSCVFSIPAPRLRDRKHMSWMKVISHHKTWEILFITPYLFLLTLFFGGRGDTQCDIKKIITWVIILHWYQGLIDYLLFCVPLKNISLTWRRHHYWWRVAKFRPMLGAQGGIFNYHVTSTVTRGLGFSGLIQRTAPFSHFLWHTVSQGEVENLF
jgi:hypothetical protein